MPRKPSAASRPEFFIDRSLGRSTTARLHQLGWTVHLVNDHFNHDAQVVKDETWIEYGLGRGWALLTKDQRIRYRAKELLSLAEHGKMFCLSSGNLTIEQQARVFDQARTRIDRAVTRHEARFYLVYADDRIQKQWPGPSGIFRGTTWLRERARTEHRQARWWERCGGPPEGELTQSGPRRLWDDIETVHQTWR